MTRVSDPERDDFVAALNAEIHALAAAVPAARPAVPLLLAGGKRLRAHLVWLAARACGGGRTCDAAILRIAAALELAHLGSLVHDDIVDATPTRRGVPTVHRLNGTAAAIDSGTALLYLASATAAPFPTVLRRTIASDVLACCRGQVRELLSLYRFTTVGERLSIMRDKTAALFELAVEAGGMIAGAPAAVRRRLRRFGRRFGIAFQIADDVLDLVGSPSRLGRPNGADLRDGVVTTPVLLAATADPRVRDHVAAAACGGPIASCIEAIVASGGTGLAARESRRWLATARQALQALPPSPARSALWAVAQRAVDESLSGVQQAHAAIAHGMTRSLEPPPWKAADRLPSAWRDASIVRRAYRIHPTVAHGALRAASIAANAPWVTCPAGAVSEDARRAARSVALAEAALAAPALTAEPTLPPLAIADSLHAVALSYLADADCRTHAAIARQVLATLSARAHAPGCSDMTDAQASA